MLGILLTIYSWTILWIPNMNAWYTTDNSPLNQFVDGRYECLVYYRQLTPQPVCWRQIWMLGILLTIHSWTILWMADMNVWYTTDNSFLNQFVDGRYECLVHYWQFTPEPFCGWQIWMLGILLTFHSWTSLLTPDMNVGTLLTIHSWTSLFSADMNAWYTPNNSLLNHFCGRQIYILGLLQTLHSWTIPWTAD